MENYNRFLTVAASLCFMLTLAVLTADESAGRTVAFGTVFLGSDNTAEFVRAPYSLKKPSVRGFSVKAAIIDNSVNITTNLNTSEGDNAVTPLPLVLATTTPTSTDPIITPTTTPTTTPSFDDDETGLDRAIEVHREKLSERENKGLSNSLEMLLRNKERHEGRTATSTETNVSVNQNSEKNRRIQELLARIKRLELKVSSLEQELVNREKQLLTRVNKRLTQRVAGHIILQVEGNGEAWYVDPATEKKFYLKDGESAYHALQAFGLGITNEDLKKIPIGLNQDLQLADTDEDDLPDSLETALGTDPNASDSDGDGYADGDELSYNFNPAGTGLLPVNISFAENLKGKILLQVKDKGQAWYVNPNDGKRYYLRDGENAYKIMRFLSLGITNNDLRQIDVGELNAGLLSE